MYRVVIRQVLENLRSLHSVGIVHRDVKPQNMIVSELGGKIKFIDLGAAADLRVGESPAPSLEVCGQPGL